jgi:aldehyde:ferredoxin oxidoreductase
MFLGGRVLGDIYMYNELSPGIDPLSPANKLFFGTGPLTGTNVPGSSRYIIHTKSPLTGLYLNGLAGGYFGPELRKTGNDMLVIEGKAERPVYLSITSDNVEVKDASRYWGMTTIDFQEFIKDELGDSKVRIACIGPAGENLALYAAVISERRAVGRGGAGAVMGSKNLKAVVVKGTGQITVAEPEAFRTFEKSAANSIKNSYAVGELFRLYGTSANSPILHEGGITPWNNWQDASCSGGESLFPQNWRDKFVRKDVRCAPPCNVMCSKLCLVTEGPFAGTLTEGPDYETEYAFGSCCGIKDQAAVIKADALCDQYGLDTISMGVSIAFAMECFEKGIINDKNTGGEEIRFGRAEILPKLIHDTAYRQGFGKTLSLGTKRMAELFGQGSDDFAMHTKGMELGGYDPRGAKSLALVYACGSRGGCHKSGGSCNAQSSRELATGDKRYLTEGKAALTKATRDNRVLADTAILCIFPQIAYSDEMLAGLINAVTGLNFSIDELYTVSERGSAIERAFNVREGLRRSWDTLPSRLLKGSVRSGPNKGQIVELDILLDDFYKLCNWDIKTGIPNPDRLKDLGLTDIGREMEKYK